jgi:hypothetical protein
MKITTLCQPTETSMLMGVNLPVSFPSNDTVAPEGNELTFNLPWCSSAEALLGSSSTVPTDTNVQAIQR